MMGENRGGSGGLLPHFPGGGPIAAQFALRVFDDKSAVGEGGVGPTARHTAELGEEFALGCVEIEALAAVSDQLVVAGEDDGALAAQERAFPLGFQPVVLQERAFEASAASVDPAVVEDRDADFGMRCIGHSFDLTVGELDEVVARAEMVGEDGVGLPDAGTGHIGAHP